VSTIATTICKGLKLDMELAQAISLGHDLGHAPFGHNGEKVLNELASSIGGFIHEVHSLRVVDKISRNGEGLNLTYAVRDGIVSHCGEEFHQSIRPEEKSKDLDNVGTRQTAPLTYEGCAVHVSDKIAYLGRDIEDAITAGLITSKDIPPVLRRNLGSTNGEIIASLVMDVVHASMGREEITFSDSKFDLICRLKDFNYERIYNHPFLIESDQSTRELIEQLYGHLIRRFHTWGWNGEAFAKSRFRLDHQFWQYLSTRESLYRSEKCPERSVVDFVAGMTDSFALDAAREILFPKPWDK